MSTSAATARFTESTATLEAWLAEQTHKGLLRFLTCGSVDDGKSTLIGRLLYDSQLILDDQLANRPFVAGDKFTLADILLFCFLAFGGQVGQPLNPEFKNIGRWYNKVAERASVKA